MAVWKQETYVNDELKYEPKYLSDGELVKRFATLLFLKQSGEDIILDIISHDNKLIVTSYKATRKMKDKTIIHIYTNIESRFER